MTHQKQTPVDGEIRNGFFINNGTFSGWFTTPDGDAYDVRKLEPREVTDPRSGEVSTIWGGYATARDRDLAAKDAMMQTEFKKTGARPRNCSRRKRATSRCTSPCAIVPARASPTSARSGTRVDAIQSSPAISAARAVCVSAATCWRGSRRRLLKPTARQESRVQHPMRKRRARVPTSVPAKVATRR